MVGIVLVSHSVDIARGTGHLVRQMAGEVPVIAVGGDVNGGLGTNPGAIKEALEHLETEEILVIMDLGSAVLSAEMVLEMLDTELRKRVFLVDAPFVEGAFAAAVMAAANADAEECIAAAVEARTELKLH